jgi:hypothetical protein
MARVAPVGEPPASAAPGYPLSAVRDLDGFALLDRSAGTWTTSRAPAADLRPTRPSLIASASGVDVVAQDSGGALMRLPVLPRFGSRTTNERRPPGVVAAASADNTVHFVALDADGLVWYRRK